MVQRSVDINLFIKGHIEQMFSGIAVGYMSGITEGCERVQKCIECTVSFLFGVLSFGISGFRMGVGWECLRIVSGGRL
jgi:hypothetical protein